MLSTARTRSSLAACLRVRPASAKVPSRLDLLQQRLGACHLSTDDVFRAATRSACLRCRGGFILDGFPRTLAQAESLKQLMRNENLPLSADVNYELPLPQIVERLSGRRTCESCKAVYHVTRQPSQVDSVCDPNRSPSACRSMRAAPPPILSGISACSCQSWRTDPPPKSVNARLLFSEIAYRRSRKKQEEEESAGRQSISA
jgi:adenylate kinase family enzyme